MEYVRSNKAWCLKGVLKEEQEMPREMGGSQGRLPGGGGY